MTVLIASIGWALYSTAALTCLNRYCNPTQPNQK